MKIFQIIFWHFRSHLFSDFSVINACIFSRWLGINIPSLLITISTPQLLQQPLFSYMSSKPRLHSSLFSATTLPLIVTEKLQDKPSQRYNKTNCVHFCVFFTDIFIHELENCKLYPTITPSSSLYAQSDDHLTSKVPTHDTVNLLWPPVYKLNWYYLPNGIFCWCYTWMSSTYSSAFLHHSN